MFLRHRLIPAFVVLHMLSSGVRADAGAGAGADWPVWGGDGGATHFSRLDQIRPENVGKLELAWTHRSGDYADGSGSTRFTSMQVTPLVVNGTLYYCTAFQRVFALDPETGTERWSFDPVLKEKKGEGPYPLNCRGLSYWEDAGAEPGAVCRTRIFYGTSDAELIALDAATGKPCADFGRDGRIDLRAALGEVKSWTYYPTSPPLVMKDRVVINGLVADNLAVNSAPGVVRAYDARRGELVWAWDPTPPGWVPGPEYRRGGLYQSGSPNSWSIMTGDPALGLVFVPTGNPGADLYGGQRKGLDFYGSATVALSIDTGQVVWHRQHVHHDVWDYDTPAPPTLFRIDGVGGGVPALVQPTKMGHLFLLDRATGAPLYPIEERPVPQGGVPGETLSPTQPFPTHPAPLHPSRLEPGDAHGFTPFDWLDCRSKIAKARWDGPFTPPTREGSIGYPHTTGGMNWGGVAIDPVRGILLVNQTHLAQVTKLLPREEAAGIDRATMQYPNELYEMEGTPYVALRNGLMSFLGAPCNPPPWGTVSAVDLKSGALLWQVPLGTLEGLAGFPVTTFWKNTGSPNFGGGMATASGLYFIGASTDAGFRAFDVRTGKVLWKTKLPFGGHAVPMSFLGASGAQYVVIAAGGNVFTRMGAELVAFRLPAAARSD